MPEDEALGHLRNLLTEKNPNLDQLVHATEQRVLGETARRGRVYDGAVAGKLACTFVELIRDTVKSALEETKRIFSMPGMPVKDSTKVGVKAIFSELQNELVRLAQGSLDRLAANCPTTPKPQPLASQIESLAAAWSSEIDLLFHAANASGERQIVLRAGGALTANLVLRQIFESAQSSES